MYQSIVKEMGAVTFPEFTGERVYMQKFTKKEGLPPHLSRWKPTVDAMLAGVHSDGPIFIMIDQSYVLENKTHRRPGVHVDGYWHEAAGKHGGSGHRMCAAGHWGECDFAYPEGVILASDISACRALIGAWKGKVGKGGDCSKIDTSCLKSIVLKGHTVYAGNVSMLHESIPVAHECARTLVRLNIPGWSPEIH